MELSTWMVLIFFMIFALALVPLLIDLLNCFGAERKRVKATIYNYVLAIFLLSMILLWIAFFHVSLGHYFSARLGVSFNFHACLTAANAAIIIILWAKCALSSPEVVTLSMFQARYSNVVVSENETNSGLKCDLCACYKDLHTHHCKVCKKCVPGMDHHCPFIVNCVGAHNRKTFLSFLWTLTLGTIYGIILSLHATLECSWLSLQLWPYIDNTDQLCEDLGIGWISLVVSVVSAVLVGFLAIAQTVMWLIETTTIEWNTDTNRTQRKASKRLEKSEWRLLRWVGAMWTRNIQTQAHHQRRDESNSRGLASGNEKEESLGTQMKKDLKDTWDYSDQVADKILAFFSSKGRSEAEGIRKRPAKV